MSGPNAEGLPLTPPSRELLDEHERQIAEWMAQPVNPEHRQFLEWQERRYAERQPPLPTGDDAPDEGEEVAVEND